VVGTGQLMTEKEWLRSNDPEAMLDFLGAKASRRRLRLFAAAGARQAFSWLEREPSALEVVRMAELLADGQVSRADLQKARQALSRSLTYVPVGLVWTARAKPADAARFYAQDVSVGARNHHADVLREIFGNPFRQPTVEPDWLTPGVTALAESIYEEHRFGDLPALAGALEGAGCTSSSILAHCRAPAIHARGCWALDLLLGKE
jgi:hypothetical protein